MQLAEETSLLNNLHSKNAIQTKTFRWKWYHLLPVLAAAIYIFSPILSWQLGLPRAIKFTGDLVVIIIIGLAIGQMISFDHFPGAFLAIVALTIIGAIVATFEGQSSDVTFYGWWIMFRFPMVGLFVYMIPDWPKSISALLPKVMITLLALQVIVQIILYLAGVRDFDNLAGTFGVKGVGPFSAFIFLVLAFALGKWLSSGDWKMLALTLAFGSIAAAIGEMKLFLIAAPLMAMVALGIQFLRGAKPRKIIVYLAIFIIGAASFLMAYDRFIVQGLGKPPLESFLNNESRNRYLDFARGTGNVYRLGRNSEVEYSWQLIQRDETTLIFGHGLGTRQYSPELGLVGEGLHGSLYGYFVGRSFLVITYEMGLLGLTAIVLFIVISSVFLYRATTRDTDTNMNVVRYAVLLYTLFWPLWIWYQEVWLMPAPSVLYWMFWGYAMHYSVSHSFKQLPTGISNE